MNVSYLFLAPGFEEMEAIAVVDVNRTGDGKCRFRFIPHAS